LKAALKRGVETGVLVQVKASYKLSAEAKKPAPKKKAITKKAAAAKKTSTKKKVSYRSCIVHDVVPFDDSLTPDCVRHVATLRMPGHRHQEDCLQGKNIQYANASFIYSRKDSN
jgi:hypothetical protein